MGISLVVLMTTMDEKLMLVIQVVHLILFMINVSKQFNNLFMPALTLMMITLVTNYFLSILILNQSKSLFTTNRSL